MQQYGGKWYTFPAWFANAIAASVEGFSHIAVIAQKLFILIIF